MCLLLTFTLWGKVSFGNKRERALTLSFVGCYFAVFDLHDVSVSRELICIWSCCECPWFSTQYESESGLATRPADGSTDAGLLCTASDVVCSRQSSERRRAGPGLRVGTATASALSDPWGSAGRAGRAAPRAPGSDASLGVPCSEWFGWPTDTRISLW